MDQLTGTDLIGHVVTYRSSSTGYIGINCVIVAFDTVRGRYTLDPMRAFGPHSERITGVHRTSFIRKGDTVPVCACGHAVLHRLPTPVCGRCNCPDHRAAPAALVETLTDSELFARVRTGTETVLYDEHGTPVSVSVPFADYLAQRADAAFHRV